MQHGAGQFRILALFPRHWKLFQVPRSLGTRRNQMTLFADDEGIVYNI